MQHVFQISKSEGMLYEGQTYTGTLLNGINTTVGGDGGCRVGEAQAGTTSPMPNHKGFNPKVCGPGQLA